MKKKLRKKIIKYTATTLIAFSLWLCGLLYFTSNLPNSAPKLPTKKLDAIVVLTGGSNRIDEGFNLLDKKLANKIFISGVYQGIDTKQLLNRWKKAEQHNLDCCVTLGFKAKNTIQNVKETEEWLKAENYKSIYLVTSNYHMPRALLEFNKRLKGINIHPYPIIPKTVDMNSWWDNETNMIIIAKEYTKYVIVKTVRFILL